MPVDESPAKPVTGVKPFTPVRSIDPTSPPTPLQPPPTFTPATPEESSSDASSTSSTSSTSDASDAPDVPDTPDVDQDERPADVGAADSDTDNGRSLGDTPPVPVQQDGRSDWQRLQAAFVDDPRAAVSAAGALVEKVIGEDTERLRIAFRDYRTLYDKLTHS